MFGMGTGVSLTLWAPIRTLLKTLGRFFKPRQLMSNHDTDLDKNKMIKTTMTNANNQSNAIPEKSTLKYTNVFSETVKSQCLY